MNNPEPKPKIMIVDDQPANLKLLEEMLEAQDFQMSVFSRGRLALTAAAHEVPDLILLDINMPEMDGYEVCKQLKADAKLKDIPVLFISARNETLDKVKAFSLGGVDYITKPFQFEEVHARVRTHLELQRQRRELQENHARLCKLEKLREDLVAMMVHDIRSPLAALLGYLEILKIRTAAKLSATELQYVDTAYDNAEKIIDMVTSLLDISRMEGGKMPLDRSAYNLVALIEDARKPIGSLVGGRRLSVWSPPEPVMVVTDKEIIQRVITNLLHNAIKFTPHDGRIDITVSQKDAMVHVAITDSGPGIPAEYHTKIFEKFGQVDRQARKHSTGLGLAFCKLAVEAHDGKIGVESEVGKGSTFWFTLPAS